VLGKTVDVFPVHGRVFVNVPVSPRLSAAATAQPGNESLNKGSRFVPLTVARQIPVGSELDATDGTVRLTTATAARGAIQSGEFAAGIFTVLQDRKQRGLTQLDIIDTQSASEVCASTGKGAVAARTRLSSRVLGRLNADDHGRFTTRGRYLAATVRGTIFTVVDRCDGTFTAVTRGEVTVRDFVRRKTVTLVAGQSYLAAAVVTTGETADIAQTTAQLSGTVNPDGDEVTACAFEYGPTERYGLSALCSPSPGAGFSPVLVSAALTQLPADATIHYRIVATNKGGTSTGADTTFKTLPDAPSIDTGQASEITPTSAKLNASVNLNGAQATQCVFEYGSSVDYGRIAACSPEPQPGGGDVAVSAQISDLAAHESVHFRVVAANAGGMSAGPDATFTTPLAPPAVTAQAPADVTRTTATLTASVNPNGGEVTSCEFEYGPTEAYGQALPCSPSPGSGEGPVSVSASLKGLTPNTTIHFRLFAANRNGISESTDHTFRTLPFAPDVDTDVATEVAETSATLNATVVPNGAEPTTCEFQYGPTEAYGKSAPCSPPPGAGVQAVPVSAVVAGLSPTTTYQYRIVAANGGGTSEGEDRTLNTPPNPLTLATPASPGFVGHPFVETATVIEAFEVQGAHVKFTVSGANEQGPVELVTNEQGEASFEYTGEHPGKDHIRASYSNDKGKEFVSEVTKTWIEPEFTLEAPEQPNGGTAHRPGVGPESSASPSFVGGVLASTAGPALGHAFIAAPVSGKVLVKPPASKTSAFLPLTAGLLPVGSELDTTAGVVALTTATAVSGKLQSGEFGGGIFGVLQPRDGGGLTELAILDTRSAHEACATADPSKVLGRLNADDHGKFAIGGQFAVATTARGAVLSVVDRCDGTFTAVTSGEATVRDLVRHKTRTLVAGQSYLVAASRPRRATATGAAAHPRAR
jgi:hypothetical protein